MFKGSPPLEYPLGKTFAFTVLDDTDDMTVEAGRAVYGLLNELNIKVTKTVWTVDVPDEEKGDYFAGQTLQNPEYRAWVKELSEQGFEIAFHNAAMASSLRETSREALAFLAAEYGKKIRLHCNHGQNLENLYWGEKRYQNALLKGLFALYKKFRPGIAFQGDEPDSAYYWKDIADRELDYIRAFSFRELDGEKIFPGRTFRDPQRYQSVRQFNTADAPDVLAFNRVVNRESIERLQSNGGWAIVSTHLGKSFYKDGKLDNEFEQNMRFLASQNGWFVPASDLLDFLVISKGDSPLSAWARWRMETGHILDRIKGRLFDKSLY